MKNAQTAWEISPEGESDRLSHGGRRPDVVTRENGDPWAVVPEPGKAVGMSYSAFEVFVHAYRACGN